MRKLSIFALLLLLISQTILGPMGTVMAYETPFSDSFTIGEGTLDGADESGKIKEGETVTLNYEWSLSGPLTEGISKTIELPKQLQASDGQSGQLLVGENVIGRYVVEDNTLNVTVDAFDVVQGEDDNNVTGESAHETDDVAEANEDSDIDEGSNDPEVDVGEDGNGNVDADATEEDGAENDETLNQETENEENSEVGSYTLSMTKTVAQATEPEQTNEAEPLTGGGTISIETIVTGSDKGEITFGGKTYTVNGEDGKEEFGFNLRISELTDLDDNPFSESNLLNPKDEFYLKLTWDLKNGHNYAGEETKVFSLPQGIKILGTIDIELRDNFGQIVAYAKFNPNNTVELTFTDFVKENSNVHGYMEIVSMIDEESAVVDDGDIVLQPISDEGEFRIPIDLGKREKAIEKKGMPNKGYNADEINWEVIINKQKVSLENASVTDVLPEGVVYKDGSLIVTKLKTDLNGNIQGDLEAVEVEGTVVDGELLIPLGDIKDAYRIEYVTTVTDEENKFKNKATLKDSSLADISADATVTINRGEPIKKSSVKEYNPKTGIVEWEIEFNYNQKDLRNVTLTDTWKPKGKMELVDGSLQFQEVTIDEDGKATDNGSPVSLPPGATFVKDTDQFEVKEITTDKAYKVTYQTKVKERVLEAFSVSNTTGFGPHSDESGVEIGTYYGSKSAGNIDYQNKTIEWKIEINHDEYPMEKISMEDTLGDGLTLDEESIEITVNGETLSEDDYTLSGDNPFTINFPDSFSTDKKIVITYKTYYAADRVPNNKATNKAAITWTPEGRNVSITKEVTADKQLNTNTGNNHWKNGSYNPDTKEITWTIYTNYRENQVGNLIIKDEPQGNQKIIEGSAVVKELEIETDGGIKEVKTLDGKVSKIDVDNNTLEVNIGETSKAYKIEYKTSIAGLDAIQKEYVNKAEVFNGKTSLSGVIVAEVGIAKAHTSGEKSGKQDGKQIHWSITVNPGQQKIDNLKLVDNISANQEYMIDTIKVYEATVDLGGKATKKGNPISPNQYILTHTEGDSTFTIDWKETVERAFIVEYSTLFFAKNNEEVTNKFTITGINLIKEDDKDNTGRVTVRQLGSGGGAGEVGYLVVNKVGTTIDGGNKNLPGAEFSLIDSNNKVYKSGTTGDDGKLDFGRLLYGTYTLKETKVPEGYVGAEDQTITIDQPYVPNDDQKKGQSITVTNHLIRQSLEFTKTDKQTGEFLDGVEFELQKEIDGVYTVIGNHVTENGGNIIIEKLEPGNYQLVETKTLDTHWLDKTPVQFTVKENQTEVTKASMENDRVGQLAFTKVAAEDNTKVLPGATFTLTNKDDSNIQFVATSNSEGVVTFTGVKYGEYTLEETGAPEGYISTKKYDVTINEGMNVLDPIENEKVIQAVKLVKVDSEDSSKKLSGAEFTLYKENGAIVEENMDGDKVPTTTNSEGELIVNKLPPGNYYFVETKAPEHYILDADQEKRRTEVFKIEENQTKFTNVEMENKRGKGSLVITKQDASNGAALSDTEFELFNSNNISVGKKVTDDKGQITFDNLPYDTYTLIETRAKAGYVPNSTEHKIVVSNADEDGKVFEKTIMNQKIIHDVHLTKYNATKTLTLPNAEFELRKMNSSLPEGYEVVTTIASEKLVTDENGTIYLTDLPVGDYQFVETKAPSGYYVNKEPINFKITTYQTRTVYVDKTNHLIPDPIWPGPVEPGKPVDPDKPKPGEPEDPSKPGDKEEPGKPGDKEEPGKPGDKEKPSKPTEPNEKDPSKPEKPGVEDPDGEDSENAEKPTEPGAPDDKDDSNKGQAGNESGNDGNGTTGSEPGKSGAESGDVEGEGISKGREQKNAAGNNTLPQTGEQSLLYMTILGLVLILLGGFMIVRRKSVE